MFYIMVYCEDIVMGKTVNRFVAEPFVNEFGETINPGDRVVYVTHSYKRVNMGKAWFDGVFKNDKGSVVLTRVRGIRSTKSIETGETKTHMYRHYDWGTREYVDRSYEYKERVDIACEPYGTTVLQHHRIIKIED